MTQEELDKLAAVISGNIAICHKEILTKLEKLFFQTHRVRGVANSKPGSNRG